MKTPVIIAACNEEVLIDRTLRALDYSQVEPYVAVNGSNDSTADIARRYTDNVYELEEPGKMPAIQYTLKRLGEAALGPVILTDADTYPVYPSQWASRLVRGLSDGPSVTTGLCIAPTSESFQNRTLGSALRVANVVDKVVTRKAHASGANMAILAGTRDVLNRVLELEHVWPKQDVILADAVTPGKRAKVLFHPQAAVRTSSRYIGSPISLLMGGKKQAREATLANRIARSAPSTIPFELEIAEAGLAD